jgi:hypothetical protein
MNNNTGVKVYVYGLLDNNNNFTYIGKSSSPLARLSTHITDGHCESRKLKIIDIFYDTEYYYIHKYINEGVKLFNKQITPIVEDWNIGDVLEVREKKKVRCKNIDTNIVYDSISSASKDLKISQTLLRSILYSKNHYLKSKYPLQII